MRKQRDELAGNLSPSEEELMRRLPMIRKYQTTVDDENEAARLVHRLLRDSDASLIEVLDDRGGNGGVIVRISMDTRKPLPPRLGPPIPADPQNYEWLEAPEPLTRGGS